jgi:DNA-binding MarR family transcriptional regulator
MESEKHEEFARLLQELVSTLKRHNDICDMLHICRREELSLPQVVTLFYVRRADCASISEISEHLNLSLAATSHLVDRLVIGGFVVRREDMIDRRHKRVSVSPTGLTLIEELERARASEIAQRLGDMPPAVLDATVTMLATVVDYLREPETMARQV